MLRTRYRKFDLTEFDKWYFTQLLKIQLTWSKDDFHHYRYYNWGWYKWAIFKSKDGDKNVIPIKILVEKIGDLSKLTID